MKNFYIQLNSFWRKHKKKKYDHKYWHSIWTKKFATSTFW